MPTTQLPQTLDEVERQVASAKAEVQSLHLEAKTEALPAERLDGMLDRLAALDRALEEIEDELKRRHAEAKRRGLTRRNEINRYMFDRAFRESFPCSECGAVGGCEHFPKEGR
jgi:hypothetical protein